METFPPSPPEQHKRPFEWGTIFLIISFAVLLGVVGMVIASLW